MAKKPKSVTVYNAAYVARIEQDRLALLAAVTAVAEHIRNSSDYDPALVLSALRDALVPLPDRYNPNKE